MMPPIELKSMLNPNVVIYDTFPGDVYTFATAGITLTDGTITAAAGTFGIINLTDETSGYQIDGVRFLTNKDTGEGKSNIILGVDAGSVSVGTNNIFIGKEAGKGNDVTTGKGHSNIYIGYQAGRGPFGADNKTTQNVGIGISALAKTNTGSVNVCIGYLAGSNIVSGTRNMIFGANSGRQITSGNDNVFMGESSGKYNVTGSFNILIGSSSGAGVSGNSFSNNTFIGFETGKNITTANNNLLLGYRCGDNLTTGANNILIGYDIDASAVGVSNELNIAGILYSADYTSKLQIGDGITSTNYMEISSTGNINFVGSAEFMIPNSINLPGTSNIGSIYLDTNAGANGTLYMYTNGAWRVLQVLP